MPVTRPGVAGPLIARAVRRLNLRYPTLFAVLAILTVADLVIPDLIPFVDEIGMALLALLVGSWKNRRPAAPGPPGPGAPS